MPKPLEKKPPAKELEFLVGPSGVIQGNLSVRESVEAMIRRKKKEA